ncbi:MAG: hypothetical protein VKJ04_04125 [Vampirovibrionales bacterium]|nr:hypothetical protein [Vampirovibrionales bacterium]
MKKSAKAISALGLLLVSLWIALADFTVQAQNPPAPGPPYSSGSDKAQEREAAKAEKARRKVRSSWDDRKVSHTVARLQKEAVTKTGSCDSNCIALYRCVASGLADEIPYELYESYFLNPLRREDMNGSEQEDDARLQAQYQQISNTCKSQVAAGAMRNETLAGLEFQIVQLDSLQSDPDEVWIEFYRSEEGISQLNQAKVVTTANKDKDVLKNVWVRQFSTRLNGNYALSHNEYNCTEKTVSIQQYVVNSPFNLQVFGDYIPSQPIPLELSDKSSEDYALYMRLCPAPPEPEPVRGEKINRLK